MVFFKKTSIPPNILDEIWEAADEENKGFLTTKEFCVALKLIACAQHGKLTSTPVLSTAVPMPYFEGIVSAKPPLPANRPDNMAQQTHLSSPKMTTPTTTDTISPDERNNYIQLFQNAGPVNGVLQGSRATTIFDRSNLPSSTLQHIWNLADTRKSGSLNQTEFIIAMHFISATLNGSLATLPATLPATIYAAATGRLTLGRQPTTMRSPIMRSSNTGESTYNQPRVSSELGRSPTISFSAPSSELNLTPEEHGKYKILFQQLAINETGSVSGADAVHFFRHSKLPETDLAKIWDLADTQCRGELTEQEFCVAMHLINRRMAGTPIPTMLPGSITQLLPPTTSVYNNNTQPIATNPPSSSAFADLLGLDDQPSDNNNTSLLSPPPPQQQQQQEPPTTTDYGHQNRSMLESNLGSIQAQIATENSLIGSLQSQQHSMDDTLQALQLSIDKEKQHLDDLKRTAEELTQRVDAQRKKKDDLTRELQMYRQESKHYQQRIDDSQQQVHDLENEISELEKVSSSSPPQDDTNVFALSSTASDHDLFAKVQDTTTSPVMGGHTNSIDPFSAKHEQKKAQTPTLNRLKEDTEMKRAPTPNVDISEVEAKFPDLNMMETEFGRSSAKVTPTASPLLSPPQRAATTIRSPQQQATRSPQRAAATTKSLFDPASSNNKTTTKASSSKYGFDLSAFEGPSSQPSSTSSFRDDLTSLFGGVSPVTHPATTSNSSTPINTTFDSLFDVSPQTTSNAFDDAFLK
ncbi:hypothetical protein BC941DRAFT_84277 [Chlamydoabsidia padenii]|nr:hypothetical protein BC941DRAFT_84277 [Chlamydoabsidia padenii]